MKPSSWMNYALRALVDLALRQATGPVTVGSIAKRQGIPVRYLEQLFNRLKRRGIVVAERGPRGGYRLGRPAGQIQVSEIFQSIEPNGLFQQGSSAVGPTASVWRQVQTAVQTTLEATTLETLVHQAREHAPADVKHRFTFHI